MWPRFKLLVLYVYKHIHITLIRSMRIQCSQNIQLTMSTIPANKSAGYSDRCMRSLLQDQMPCESHGFDDTDWPAGHVIIRARVLYEVACVSFSRWSLGKLDRMGTMQCHVRGRMATAHARVWRPKVWRRPVSRKWRRQANLQRPQLPR